MKTLYPFLYVKIMDSLIKKELYFYLHINNVGIFCFLEDNKEKLKTSSYNLMKRKNKNSILL